MNNENIDELLNSYIDGELTQRQRTELERLIINDKVVAERLKEIGRCKILVSSLPIAETPPEMFENISKLIEKRSLLGESSEYFNNRKGIRHLVYRKMVAAAAIIVLIAVLGVMIYKVAVPPRLINKPLAFHLETEFNRAPPEAANTDLDENRLIGRIELRTTDPNAVNSVIGRAMKDNGLRWKKDSANNSNESIYIVTETFEKLSGFIADMRNVWTELDEATLLVQHGRDKSVVEWVSASQLEKILKQTTATESIKLAKEYAVINNSAEQLMAKQNKGEAGDDLLSIPRPVLTGQEKSKQMEYSATGDKIDLTIVVIGAE